jgi:hypothetical protein
VNSQQRLAKAEGILLAAVQGARYLDDDGHRFLLLPTQTLETLLGVLTGEVFRLEASEG